MTWCFLKPLPQANDFINIYFTPAYKIETLKEKNAFARNFFSTKSRRQNLSSYMPT